MNSGARGRRILAACLEIGWWWGAAVGVWLLTLSAVTWPELVAAAVCGLPCGLVARAGRHAMQSRWRPRLRWAGWLPPLAAAVIADTARVLALAARQATGRGRPGRLTELRLPPGEPGPVAAARRALTAFALSATPGTIAVDSDPEEDVLVIHSVAGGWPRLEEKVSR